MAYDQSINYRVNIDDSNFQAKLTQMRASIDSTVGASIGGNASFGRAMAYLGPMGGGGPTNFGVGSMSGIADFGAQIAPVTYTPPAIAMQPHFGMFQIQQTLGQAGLTAAFGPAGIAFNGIRANGIFSQRDPLPPNISYQEYMGYSTRAFADRMGANAAAAAGTGLELGANILGGIAGTGIASAMGATGMVGSILGSIAGGSLLAAPVAMATSRAAESLGIQSTLEAGSFRAYQGTDVDSQTGRGFNRRDRLKIATGISRMESNDARLGMGDYKQILEGGLQMDLFSGTKDAEDFQKKFKGLVETVKTVSSTLHTTLKEGLETIRGLRDMGITDPVAQQSAIMRSEVLGRASGKTGMEMMAIGQTGAELFRGTGISMQRGFELNQQNTAMIQQMLNQGSVSRETVAQMGGVNAAAQQMTSGALASFQTTLGRGALMASFNPATTGLDPNMIQKMASGDAMSMMGNAAAVMSSPANMFKFQAHQEEMISKLTPGQMQAFSIAQTMQAARTLQGAFGGDMRDIYMAEAKRSGKSKEQVDIEMGMLTMDPQKYKEQMMTQNASMAAQQNLEAARNNYMGVKYVTNAFTRAVTQPLSEGITGIANTVSRKTEDITQDIRQAIFGGSVDARQLNAGTVTSANRFMEEEVKYKMRQATAAKGRPLTEAEAKAEAGRAASEVMRGTGGTISDISETGVMDYIGSVAGGKGTALGSMLRDVEAAGIDKAGNVSISGVQIKTYASTEEAQKAAKASGDHLNVLGSVKGRVVAVSDEAIGEISERRRKMQVSDEEVDKQMKIVEQDKASIERVALNPTVSAIGKEAAGKDFSMKKWMAGGYGKDINARMVALSRAAGATDAEATISKMSGTEELGAVNQLSTAEATKRLKDIRGGLGATLRGTLGAPSTMDVLAGGGDIYQLFNKSKGYEALSGALEDDTKFSKVMEATAALAHGDKQSEAYARKALRESGIGADQVSQVISELKLAKKEDPNKFAALAKSSSEFLNLTKQVETANRAAAGSDIGAAGGIAGDISGKTMEAMTNMMKTFETQLKIVQALQESFKASLKVK